jgi:hypothetical protein
MCFDKVRVIIPKGEKAEGGEGRRRKRGLNRAVLFIL